MSVIAIGTISAVAVWKTTKWLFQLPPRVFSWAMDNKIKALLLMGALYYGQTSARIYLAEKEVERKKAALEANTQKIIERLTKKNKSERDTKEITSKKELKTNNLTGMTFRNIPTVPSVSKKNLYPKQENQKEKKQQEQLTRDGINAIQNHTLSSRPVFRPMPITGKEY